MPISSCYFCIISWYVDQITLIFCNMKLWLEALDSFKVCGDHFIVTCFSFVEYLNIVVEDLSGNMKEKC